MHQSTKGTIWQSLFYIGYTARSVTIRQERKSERIPFWSISLCTVPYVKIQRLSTLCVWKRSYVNRNAHKQIHTVVLCGLFLRSFGLLEIYCYNSSDSKFLKDFQKIFLSYVTNAIFCNYILWEDKLKYRDISDQDINSILLFRLQRKTSVAEICQTEWRCGRQCRMKLYCNESKIFSMTDANIWSC